MSTSILAVCALHVLSTKIVSHILSLQLSQQYGESQPIPAVRVVNAFGPCAAAGIQAGDLISSINGGQVASIVDFNTIVSSVCVVVLQSVYSCGQMHLVDRFVLCR